MEDMKTYLYPAEFGSPRQVEGEDQKLNRECALLLGGLREGFTKAAQEAENNPMVTIGKISIAAASGSLLSQTIGAGGACSFLARGAASAMGLMAVAELTHLDRLNSLHRAISDTWQTADNFDASKTKVAGALGPLAFDTLLMTAGGIAGSAYACRNPRSLTNIQEWPNFTMTKDGFAHSFGDDVLYRTSPRGAELLLPNGETFRWRDKRPFFQTNGTTVEFAGGSRLKIDPGKTVEFNGRFDNGILNLKSDLKNDFHISEYDRWTPGKPETRQWERVYRLSDGTMMVQYPGSVYQITTPQGGGMLYKDNLLHDVAKVNLEFGHGSIAPGARAPKPAKFETDASGLPKALFDDGTEISFGKDGKAIVKGIMVQEFQL